MGVCVVLMSKATIYLSVLSKPSLKSFLEQFHVTS